MAISAIWFQWWVEANEETPNENLGLYLGIYGLLSFSSLTAIIIACW